MNQHKSDKTKAKTAEFDLKKVIDESCNSNDLKCTFWEGDEDYDATREAKADLFNKINSHIANLEAQNKELREALEKIMDSELRNKHDGMKSEVYKIARKAVYGEE